MTDIKFIDGGVTAAKGFLANGVLCKIKESRKTPDVALIYSEKMCNAAALFTQNKVQAESVKLCRKNIANGKIQAVIVNSGNANCCTGENGAEVARKMALMAGGAVGVESDDVFVCSTGVIGQQLPIEEIEAKIDELKNGLSKDGHETARQAIMTTDTQPKECAVETIIGGKTVRIGAMCKGSGMIHINLGTMLSFVTTDCAISAEMLKMALQKTVATTYNCVSIDGDTSTNDTLVILANGMAENAEITADGEDFEKFQDALNTLNTIMAMKIAADGEGATRLVQCTVTGAKDDETARGLAKEVICSNLVKAAMFGRDANCGRILCAMGYSGFDFTPEKTSVFFSAPKNANRFFDDNEKMLDWSAAVERQTKQSGQASPRLCSEDCSIEVVHDGVGLSFDEAKAESILSEQIVNILVTLQDGDGNGKAWGCDLTYDYVKINGDYRT